MKNLSKKIDHAFNKDIYLLGEDDQGIRYWLEAPSWDCEHYWGFGYVETYTNNSSPSHSKDISSHQHVNSSLLGKGNAKDGGYCHNLFDSTLLVNPTFTEKEGWELGELFSQFYHLKEQAAFYGQGNSHVASTTIQSWKNETLEQKINKEIIPVVTARIIEILTPSI